MYKKITILFFLVFISLSLSCKRSPLPPPVVLFDQGHGQRFLIENDGDLDLSKLASSFEDQGFEVKSSQQKFTSELLKGVSTLIISGPFTSLTDQEVATIDGFVQKGGQMCVMLHIGAPVTQLLNSLGVDVSNGVIREQNNLLDTTKTTDFFVTSLAPHPLTKNLTQINLYGSWALNTQIAANIIAKTSPTAWIDLNRDEQLGEGDAIQPFSVVVTGQAGHGHYIIFADDAIFQNHFLVGQNQQLAQNMASWLKAGSYY